MEGDRTEVGESDMKRRKRGKQTLKRKMLSILLLCAMSCILAVVIVSYMTIRMIQNDSIQESMQIYLEQITREIDSDYYDMIGIVNQMSPNGLIGSVTESYLSAEDNYNRYFEQKSLREELIKLGYVNTKLLGIAYYDPKEQKELIGNFNVRMSRQDNITEFVQRLKRLLSYNLGKEGMQTTLRTEIDIVKDYIALEQMRYDFVIEMNVEEGRYLEQPTVRMLLQPLVENAIRYGLGDDEKITIQVFEDNIRGLAIITILDSGNGLPQEEINQINEPFDYDVKKMQHGNRGIGLRYVKAMLESFYEGETNLFVNCKKGYGTKITILIPIQEELRNKIKFTGSETEKEGMEK